MASRGPTVDLALFAMISPNAAALASSAACIATTSSRRVAASRVRLATEPETPNPKAPQAMTVHMTASGTRPLTAAVRRHVLQTLMASGILRKTNADIASKLTEHILPVCFPPGHVVFGQGDTSNGLYIIASGKVKLTYRHRDGREVLLNVFGASDVFGEIAFFDCGTREATATTLTEASVLAIERDQLLGWMAKRPEVIHQFMRLLARRADWMTKCLDDFVVAIPAYRVAKRLVMLGRRFGKREGDVVVVTHDLTLEEISLFAGVAAATVDAALRDFADRGWIRFVDRHLELVDGHGLDSLSAQ